MEGRLVEVACWETFRRPMIACHSHSRIHCLGIFNLIMVRPTAGNAFSYP
jgi:hypothetical protein